MSMLVSWTVKLLVGLSIVFVTLGYTSAQSTTTCDDFTYQEDAQVAWDDGEGRPRPGYSTGMDEDFDGIACEHLPEKPAFYETDWFRIAVVLAIVTAMGLGILGFWWSRKVKAANKDRASDYLFPGRSSRQEVEDELALLKADKAIDDDSDH